MQRLSPTRLVLGLSATFILAVLAFVSVPWSNSTSGGGVALTGATARITTLSFV